jgi:hypothetical protein
MQATTERRLDAPAWCVTDFPDQVRNLVTELDTCKKQVEAASKRIEYIQKIFAYCAQATDWLNFADENVVSGVVKVLDVAGWKATVDPSNPQLLRLEDEVNPTVFALVALGAEPPARAHVSVLIKRQTDWWQDTGVEPKAFIIYSGEGKEVDADLQPVLAKKSMGLLAKKDLLKLAAEVLLKETDPDDLRMSFLMRIAG